MHLHITNYPCVALGIRHITTLDHVQKDIADKSLNEWHQLFKQTLYQDKNFLKLVNFKNHKPEMPTYLKGKTWLSHLEDPCICAKFCRAVLNSTLR